MLYGYGCIVPAFEYSVLVVPFHVIAADYEILLHGIDYHVAVKDDVVVVAVIGGLPCGSFGSHISFGIEFLEAYVLKIGGGGLVVKAST